MNASIGEWLDPLLECTRICQGKTLSFSHKLLDCERVESNLCSCTSHPLSFSTVSIKWVSQLHSASPWLPRGASCQTICTPFLSTRTGWGFLRPPIAFSSVVVRRSLCTARIFYAYSRIMKLQCISEAVASSSGQGRTYTEIMLGHSALKSVRFP